MDVDELDVSNMTSFDQLSFTKCTKAYAGFVVEDYQEVWKATVDGAEKQSMPKPKHTCSRRFSGKAYPFGGEGIGAFRRLCNEVKVERGKEENDRLMLPAVKSHFHEQVDLRMLKRKMKADAKKTREAERNVRRKLCDAMDEATGLMWKKCTRDNFRCGWLLILLLRWWLLDLSG